MKPPVINTPTTIMSFFMSLTFFITSIVITTSSLSFIIVFEFFSLPSATFEFPIVLDTMSTMFASLVLLISSAVILYSTSYMSDEYLNKRFTLLVILFITSMMFLIFALNIIAVMLGWDGLGLTSFILVAYYQSKKSNSASMITALSNRIGDSALLVVIALMAQTNSWNFLLTPLSSFNTITILFVMLAAMTKSAQMPFSAWLPAAMAAPTPVSALVHSSTLVTAGIYLLIRFNPLIMKLSLNHPLIFIGLLTSIMASLSGCTETNLKKIVALSTLSQLGLMAATLALGMSTLAFFHLLTHAAFKALLFIACGKMIHESSASQDLRLMGGLMNKIPFTWITLNISNFALSGLPFLAGFYSKDLIYESALMNHYQTTIFVMFSLAIALSLVYSVRMMFFSMSNNQTTTPLFNTSETDPSAMKSMKILAVPAMTSGALISWLMFNKPLMILLPPGIKILPTTFLIICFSLGLMISLSSRNLPPSMTLMLLAPLKMWHLPVLTSSTAGPALVKSNQLKQLETGWLELLSAQGLSTASLLYSANITKSQAHQTPTLLALFAVSIFITLLSAQSS